MYYSDFRITWTRGSEEYYFLFSSDFSKIVRFIKSQDNAKKKLTYVLPKQRFAQEHLVQRFIGQRLLIDFCSFQL